MALHPSGWGVLLDLIHMVAIVISGPRRLLKPGMRLVGSLPMVRSAAGTVSEPEDVTNEAEVVTNETENVTHTG